MPHRASTGDHHARGPEAQAGNDGVAVSDPLDGPRHHQDLGHHQGNAHQGEGDAQGLHRPAIAIGGIEHDGGGQGHLGQGRDERHPRQAEQLRVPAQQHQRPDGIGPPPAEVQAHGPGQGFRQGEEAVDGIGQAEGRGHVEGQSRPMLAQYPADAGAQHKPKAEGRAQQAEGAGPPLRRRRVRHIGAGDAEAGPRHPGQHPADEQPDEVRGPGHGRIAQTQADVRGKDQRAPPEPVRQGPDDRGAEELHQGEDGVEHPEDHRGLGRVLVHELPDEPGQDRGHQTQGHDVQQDGDEDEHHRPASGFRAAGGGIGQGGDAHAGPRSRCCRTEANTLRNISGVRRPVFVLSREQW